MFKRRNSCTIGSVAPLRLWNARAKQAQEVPLPEERTQSLSSSQTIRMDDLLAGTLFSLCMEFQCRLIVQRRCTSCCLPVENIPLQGEHHSSKRAKVFAFPTGTGVRLQNGMLFGFTTEWCSPSERNRVRLRPDSPALTSNLLFSFFSCYFGRYFREKC